MRVLVTSTLLCLLANSVAHGQDCGGTPGYSLTAPSQVSVGTTMTMDFQAPAGSFAFLFLSHAQAFTPTAFGNLCVALPAIVTLPLSITSGSTSLSGDIPCDGAWVGMFMYSQFLVILPADKRGVSNLLVTEFTHDMVCQGCTPGYWKQSQHFDSWPSTYAPDMLFSDVFEDALPGQTLLEVLEKDTNGGVSALEILATHTVAALLNAESSGVNYGQTAAQVIQAFNDVYPGTDTDYLTLKDFFDASNNFGCPLN